MVRCDRCKVEIPINEIPEGKYLCRECSKEDSRKKQEYRDYMARGGGKEKPE